VPGADGQQWAFIGDTELGNATFKPDESKGKTKPHLRLIPSPSQRRLARLPEGEGVVAGTLSAARIAEVRSQLPALAHRTL
jgi:hypothetical protein